jgi:phosphoglycolate phosphatase
MDPLPFSRLEAFLFDFDGTLASLQIDFNALREGVFLLAASFGLENPRIPDPPYLLELTRSFKDQIEALNPEAAVSFYHQAMGLIEEAERQAARPENLFPITPALLLRLKEKNIKRAVLTRNSENSVYRVFPDLDNYIEVFLPREKVPHPKPDPRHIQQALSCLNVPAEKTVLVGDHPSDILAGRKSGTFTIGVLSGRTAEREMRQAGADMILPHIDSLMKLI